MNLNAGGQPEHILVLPTQANFFSLLGVKPMMGRTWAEGEDQPGKDAVIILSYAFWNEPFCGGSADGGPNRGAEFEEVYRRGGDARQLSVST